MTKNEDLKACPFCGVPPLVGGLNNEWVRCKEHIDGWIKIDVWNTRANVTPADGDAERLREALEMLYDAWENGAPCFENDGGNQDSFIGNAFELTYEEEQKVLKLIPRERKQPRIKS